MQRVVCPCGAGQLIVFINKEFDQDTTKSIEEAVLVNLVCPKCGEAMNIKQTIDNRKKEPEGGKSETDKSGD